MAQHWKIYYARWMVVWAVVSQVWLVLQATKIFQSKSAEGVSLYAYILYTIGTVMWFINATFVNKERNTAYMISSSLGFCLGIVILVGIIMYGGENIGLRVQPEPTPPVDT